MEGWRNADRRHPLTAERVGPDSAELSIIVIRYDTYYYFAAFFRAINQSGAKNLIVDLRENGGGSDDASATLLQFLMGPPFTRNKALLQKLIRFGDLQQ